MIYWRSDQFNRSYRQLPRPIQDKAVKAFRQFRENPAHPSLGVKKVKRTPGIWEGRVDYFWRFTFKYQTSENGDPVCYFLNIGRHEIVTPGNKPGR
jgi:mRNA-degrading endonuclease RelE of RelBE toxin-antitoxin system